MPNMMKIDPDILRKEINQMIDALTSPPFVEAMRAVRAVPASQRLAEGAKRLNPDLLREQGVPLPSNMRISSRYFDDELPEPVEVGEVGTMSKSRMSKSSPDMHMLGGCCCGGGATVCGGCGGDSQQLQ